MNQGRVLVLATLCLMLLGGCAHHFDIPEERFDRVEFEVTVDRPVENDLARAVLAVERENVDPATLAQDVNRAMAAALREARDQSGIDVRSGDYRTWPVHEERRIVRWRAEQELILESTEPEALHRLAGSLQRGLVLRSLGYTVSAGRRRSVEEALVAEALEAFRARARLVTETLGARDYDIVNLRLQGTGAPPPVPFVSRALSMAESAPVAGEPGTSRLTAGVYAIIQLRD